MVVKMCVKVNVLTFALCLCFSSGALQREVYFMGLINVLTHYDTKKKAAHAAKTVKHGVSDTCLSLSVYISGCLSAILCVCLHC